MYFYCRYFFHTIYYYLYNIFYGLSNFQNYGCATKGNSRMRKAIQRKIDQKTDKKIIFHFPFSTDYAYEGHKLLLPLAFL